MTSEERQLSYIKNKNHKERINKFDNIYILKNVCSRKDTTDKTASKLHT